MMRGTLVALALLFVPGALMGQTFTDLEREILLESFQRTDKQLVELTETLTPEQWNFKPAADRWSIAEVAEHILISEQMFKQMITGPLMETERTEEMASAASRSEELRAMMLDRSQRFQAPPPAQPTGRWASQAEFLEAWRAERHATIQWVKDTDADLHGHELEHPAAGTLSGEEWTSFMAGHCERHMLQIDEVMADSHFPKSMP